MCTLLPSTIVHTDIDTLFQGTLQSIYPLVCAFRSEEASFPWKTKRKGSRFALARLITIGMRGPFLQRPKACKDEYRFQFFFDLTADDVDTLEKKCENIVKIAIFSSVCDFVA